MSLLLWLLPALPLGVGTVVAVTGRRGDRVAAPAAVASAAVVLALAVAVAAGRPAVTAPFLLGIPAELAVDGLSAIAVVTVAAVSLAVLVFSAGEFGPDEARARFYGLMLVFEGAMLLTVTATNLAVLLFGWEIMGAASYALIGYWWREKRRVVSGSTAFLTTRAADLGLYLAAGAALAGAGSLSFAALPDATGGWLHAVTAGVVVAAIGKSAQLPFSFWLSRAMDGPSPVSALLHAAAMVVAGAYLLLRLEPLLTTSGWAAPVVAWVGVVTALALGAVAVAQRDLKQLLAASTASQVGFMVLGAGAAGVAGGTMHLVAHGATKTLLFLAAGAWLTALGTKQLPALRGAARRYPVVGLTFAAGALTLAGVPPLSLWATKDEVLAAARHESAALYVVGLAAAALAAAYSAKALLFVVRPLRPVSERPDDAYDTERRGTRRVHALQRAPLVVLAVAAAVLGLQALPPVAEAYKRALGVPGEPSPAWWEPVLSAAVAIAAIGAVAVLARRPVAAPAALAGWLRLEAVAVRGVVRPVLGSARALATVDDRVLDGVLVGGVVAGGRRLAAVLRRGDDSGVDGAVRALARGARWLGSLARAPQTGMLHQYYAQTAVAVVVLAVAFVVVGLVG